MTAPGPAPLRQVTDADLAAAVSCAGPMLVAFNAAWCQPCARILPELVDLAGGVAKALGCQVLTAELDDAQDAALAADVRGVPCLVLYRDGGVHARRIGHAPAATLADWLRGALS